ncbi:MAG TPA: hypothetical protein VGN46_09025 [Luteibacter sp.]|uniref:hypothetical protein n=1 Tax=Luteibacter sp. TaxID=1886636 RepID=UPI002F428A48
MVESHVLMAQELPALLLQRLNVFGELLRHGRGVVQRIGQIVWIATFEKLQRGISDAAHVPQSRATSGLFNISQGAGDQLAGAREAKGRTQVDKIAFEPSHR